MKLLEMWTIYDHPDDMPDCFVARKFRVLPTGPEPTRELRAAGSLEEVRSMLPLGLVNLGRYEDDEPQIVETWI